MITGQAKGLMLNVVVPVQPLESVAVMVAVPVEVGVPDMTPELGSMPRPAGKLAVVQVYGAVPPLALGLAE